MKEFNLEGVITVHISVAHTNNESILAMSQPVCTSILDAQSLCNYISAVLPNLIHGMHSV